ncbi:Uu.00g114700.m01.CDS01 [Anthostomella pinea]|uniref:Uu.00g114700.m01.CDS01 n=1 Tax=Anthostomella pinea TaxID=933095 RepID=A0AAI8VGF0_9PEZI|nr:Uu.00g114700.m01.CDS01 [Anthostomella pinea]
MPTLFGFEALTPSAVVLATLSIVVLYYGVQCVYLLFFHPLAKYPGPKLAAISELWYAWGLTSDRLPFIVHDLHLKYGDVVRIGPNEVSFATSQAFQDIHGHVSKGKGRFLKTDFYDNDDPNPRITTARDPEVHARQRKALSHGFSAKSLRDQEDVVHKYVDMFVEQLANIGEHGEKALNMSDVFNWLTFDIIGDLAFGEPFGAVEDGRTHFWVSLLFGSLIMAQMTTLRRKLPILNLVLPYVLPKGAAEDLKRHRALTREKTLRRIALGDTGRDDFFSHMLKKNTMPEGEMIGQSHTLILAGSETTATFLSAVTWHLLKNLECMKKLQEEVRGAFTSQEQITGDSTAGLQYLHGVQEEGLRIFPPVPLNLPRYSPGASVDGHYIPEGLTVSVNSLTVTRDPRYFEDPDAFRPERWIDEEFHDEKKASQPFSAGSRVCLGINLAYLEMRIILAKLVWAFDWELAEELDDWLHSNKMRILWKKPDLWVKYHPRTAA